MVVIDIEAGRACKAQTNHFERKETLGMAADSVTSLQEIVMTIVLEGGSKRFWNMGVTFKMGGIVHVSNLC